MHTLRLILAFIAGFAQVSALLVLSASPAFLQREARLRHSFVLSGLLAPNSPENLRSADLSRTQEPLPSREFILGASIDRHSSIRSAHSSYAANPSSPLSFSVHSCAMALQVQQRPRNDRTSTACPLATAGRSMGWLARSNRWHLALPTAHKSRPSPY